jgi:hypothetical protein
MWNIANAIALIESIRPKIEEQNFSVALTGGVLFRCHSSKDMDLVFYPMNQVKPDYSNVLAVLMARLPVKSIVAVNHPIDAKLVFTVHLQDKKRIDLFFPGYTYAERTDGFKTAGEIAGSGATEEGKP